MLTTGTGSWENLGDVRPPVTAPRRDTVRRTACLGPHGIQGHRADDVSRGHVTATPLAKRRYRHPRAGAPAEPLDTLGVEPRGRAVYTRGGRRTRQTLSHVYSPDIIRLGTGQDAIRWTPVNQVFEPPLEVRCGR